MSIQMSHLTTIARQFSRNLFERNGLTVYDTESADDNGAIFFRYLMRHELH